MNLGKLIGSLAIVGAGMFLTPIVGNAQSQKDTIRSARHFGGVSLIRDKAERDTADKKKNRRELKGMWDRRSFEAIVQVYSEENPEALVENETTHYAAYKVAYKDNADYFPIAQFRHKGGDTVDIFYATDAAYKPINGHTVDPQVYNEPVKGRIAMYRHIKHPKSTEYSKNDVIQKQVWEVRDPLTVGSPNESIFAGLVHDLLDNNPFLKPDDFAAYPELEINKPGIQTLGMFRDNDKLVILTGADTTKLNMRNDMNGMVIVKTYEKPKGQIGFKKENLKEESYSSWLGTPQGDQGIEYNAILTYGDKDSTITVNNRYDPLDGNPGNYVVVNKTVRDSSIVKVSKELEKKFTENLSRYDNYNVSPAYAPTFDMNNLWSTKGQTYPGQGGTKKPAKTAVKKPDGM